MADSHASLLPGDAPHNPNPIDDVVWQRHEIRIRRSLYLFFGGNAGSITKHFEAMKAKIAKDPQLAFVGQNPEIAPWIYAQKLGIQKRELTNGSQRVYFGKVQGAGVIPVHYEEGNRVKETLVSQFLMLKYENSNSPVSEQHYIFRLNPLATGFEIEKASRKELDKAISEQSNTRRAAALAATKSARSAAAVEFIKPVEIVRPPEPAKPAQTPNAEPVNDAQTDTPTPPKSKPRQLRLDFNS